MPTLQPAITIEDNPAEVFCLRWSEDGQYLASGIGDGSLRVFSADRYVTTKRIWQAGITFELLGVGRERRRLNTCYANYKQCRLPTCFASASSPLLHHSRISITKRQGSFRAAERLGRGAPCDRASLPTRFCTDAYQERLSRGQRSRLDPALVNCHVSTPFACDSRPPLGLSLPSTVPIPAPTSNPSPPFKAHHERKAPSHNRREG